MKLPNFFQGFLDKSLSLLYSFGMRLIYAVIVLIIGLLLIKFMKRILDKWLQRSDMELSLKRFLESLNLVVLYGILIFLIGLTFGVQVSSFMTLLGAAGIAIGLALQGSLSNFAGGILILLFKPFKIGDEVELEGIEGIVDDIDILYTRISDWRGQIYTLPNGKVSNVMVKNNSATGLRRVEISLRFPLDTDFDQLRALLTDKMKDYPNVLTDRPIQLWLRGIKEYYLDVSARCWCTDGNYWGVYWGQVEHIKKVLEEEGIKFAVPTQEVALRERAV